MSTAYELMPEVKKQPFWTELWEAVIEAFVSLLEQGDLNHAMSVVDKATKMPDQQADDRHRLMGALMAYAGRLANEHKLEDAMSLLFGRATSAEEALAI